MEIMNTQNATLKLEELGNIDPRLIVSMAVVSSEKVHIAHLTDLVSLSKKAKIIISGESAGGVQIKSIQYLSGANTIVVAEIVGAMTPDARSAIKKMIKVMEGFQVTNAFFPGNMSVESRGATCFIGKTADDLMATPVNIKNLRISRDSLVFSDADRVKKIYIQEYKTDGWKTNLFVTILKANQEIKFLGRIKDWCVPVTLKDGTIAQLDTKSGRREPAIKTFDGVIKTSAYIGEVFGGKHAVVSGNQLVTA